MGSSSARGQPTTGAGPACPADSLQDGNPLHFLLPGARMCLSYLLCYRMQTLTGSSCLPTLGGLLQVSLAFQCNSALGATSQQLNSHGFRLLRNATHGAVPLEAEKTN